MAKKSNKPTRKSGTKKSTSLKVKVIGFKSISATKTTPKKKTSKQKR